MNGWWAIPILALIVACGFLIYWGPIWSVMAVNLLFGTEIPFTTGTWWAAFWLNMVVGSGFSFGRGK